VNLDTHLGDQVRARPLVLAGIGLGMVIAPVINTSTFGVARQDVGVASATVTVGQMLGGSVGTSLLNTIFASAVTSYIAAHLTSARLIGRQALTGLALTHGYHTGFWWLVGIFASCAVAGGILLRPGPLGQKRTPPPGGRPGNNGTSRGGPRSRCMTRAAPGRNRLHRNGTAAPASQSQGARCS
jgi:hypothetical protein